MAVTFTRTQTFLGRSLVNAAYPFYEVHLDGEFWGWVSGERRSFRAFRSTGGAWGRAARTRQGAFDAFLADESRAAELADRPRKETRKVLLTIDNVNDVDLVGWVLEGAEDLGLITNIRATYDGFENARIIGDRGRDILALPSTVTAYRV